MSNQEKFFGLLYKVLKVILYLWLFTSVYGIGCLIGLLLRNKFF